VVRESTLGRMSASGVPRQMFASNRPSIRWRAPGVGSTFPRRSIPYPNPARSPCARCARSPH
jgi:hypothetical protein